MSSAGYLSSAAAANPAAKRQKLDQMAHAVESDDSYVLRLSACWYEVEHNTTTEISVFEDELGDKRSNNLLLGFGPDRRKLATGENFEHNLSVELLLGKDAKSAVVSTEIYWWAGNNAKGANLMHFNQLEQDLADFCRILWKAAGESPRSYCDMDIEFGDSIHCGRLIRNLIDDATMISGKEVIYIRSIDCKGGSPTQSQFSLLFKRMGSVFPSAILIAHTSDLVHNVHGFEGIGDGWLAANCKSLI